MEFYSYHGCLESERRLGNRFEVDFTGFYNMDIAAQSDKLTDAIDYSMIYQVIKLEMEKPSNLLEHLAARMLDVLQYSFPELDTARITVRKYNPPVGGKVEYSSVTMEF